MTAQEIEKERDLFATALVAAEYITSSEDQRQWFAKFRDEIYRARTVHMNLTRGVTVKREAQG